MRDLLIHDCRVLTFDEANQPVVLQNQDIAIDGNRIAAIQPVRNEHRQRAKLLTPRDVGHA